MNALKALERKTITTRIAIQAYEQAIAGLTQNIKEIDQEIKRLVKQDDSFNRMITAITSTPGIGMLLAANLVDTMISTKTGGNLLRWQGAVKDKALEPLRQRKLIETTAEHYLAVLKAGSISTNVYLRRIHNYAVNTHWLPWPVLPTERARPQHGDRERGRPRGIQSLPGNGPRQTPASSRPPPPRSMSSGGGRACRWSPGSPPDIAHRPRGLRGLDAAGVLAGLAVSQTKTPGSPSRRSALRNMRRRADCSSPSGTLRGGAPRGSTVKLRPCLQRTRPPSPSSTISGSSVVLQLCDA